MYKYIILIIFSILIKNGYSQTYKTLNDKWLYAKTDSAKINAGIKLYDEFYKLHDDSIKSKMKLATELYDLSTRQKNSNGIIQSSFFIGNCYIYLNKTPNAVKFYLISLKESEKTNNLTGIARAKMGIGMVYFTINNYPKAIKNFENALTINRRLKNYQKISLQQYLIGYSLVSLKEYTKAKLFIDSSIKLISTLDDSVGLMQSKFALANCYKGQEKYKEATNLYNQLLPEFKARREWVPLSMIYMSLAEILYLQGKLPLALNYLRIADEFATKVSNPVPRLNVSELRYKIYRAMGDNNKAFIFLNRYSSLKDSIVNFEFISQISISEATYNYEKEESVLKEKQVKREAHYQSKFAYENRKQIVLTAITLLAILVVISIYFAYRWMSKQKRISENLLRNILPEETAKELKKYGMAVPRNHSGISIMFCDIKNFSQIAEKLSPEAVVEMLDFYFKNFDTIMEEFGIEKIKTIGDAYMCAAGLHHVSNENERNIIAAAQRILEFSMGIENLMIKKYGIAFYFRIGIHTGSVVSGVVGRKKFTYDIWGDAVNIAARMEQNSIPGKINISGDTFNFVKDYFNCEYRGKIAAKNKGEIDMYFVLNPY